MRHEEKEITLSLSYDEYDAICQAVSIQINELGMCGLETTVLCSADDKLQKWHDKFHSANPTPTTVFAP